MSSVQMRDSLDRNTRFRPKADIPIWVLETGGEMFGDVFTDLIGGAGLIVDFIAVRLFSADEHSREVGAKSPRRKLG